MFVRPSHLSASANFRSGVSIRMLPCLINTVWCNSSKNRQAINSWVGSCILKCNLVYPCSSVILADTLDSIRSFDNTRSETIQFHTPLTLIVGYNGSGKTACRNHPCEQQTCWQTARLLLNVSNMRQQEIYPQIAKAVPLFTIPRFV